MSEMLRLSNVIKTFGGLLAIDDRSFHFDRGESLGLIGPNGAGKTAIFSLIMGEYRPNGDPMKLNGEKISRLLTHARVRRGISRTYQVPPFAEMNIAENIRLGLMPDSLRAIADDAGRT